MYMVLFGFLVFLSLIHCWYQRKNYFLYYQIGGPFGIPFLGVALKFLDAKEIIPNLYDINKRYGSICCSWIGSKFVLYVSDPHIIKAVFNNSECLNKSQLYEAMEPLVKTGILIAKGVKWQRRRKILTEIFSHKNVMDFTAIFNIVSNDFIIKLESDNKLDLHELIQRVTLEAACYTTMGQRLNLVNESNSDIFHSFNKVMEILVEKLSKPWLNNTTIFRISSKLYKIEEECLRIFKSYIRTIIDKKFSEKKVTNKSYSNVESRNVAYYEKPKRNFIEKIYYLFEKNQITSHEVEDESNTIIMTAFETLSSFTYSTIILLAMHSNYQEKLRKELLNLGIKPNNEITYEDLRNTKFLDMVLNESMRLMPPVPVTIRLAEKDLKLNDKITIPEGTQLLIDIFHLQRDKKYYGVNCEKFNPDNFLPEAIAHRHPYSFIPFAKGLRACVGTKYTYLFAKILFIKLLQQFKITTTTKLEELRFTEAVSLKIQNDIKLKFEKIS